MTKYRHKILQSPWIVSYKRYHIHMVPLWFSQYCNMMRGDALARCSSNQPQRSSKEANIKVINRKNNLASSAVRRKLDRLLRVSQRWVVNQCCFNVGPLAAILVQH